MRWRFLLPGLACVLLLTPMGGEAQVPRSNTKRRAKPPTFEKGEFEGVFFRNLFQEGLVGQRPALPQDQTARVAATASPADADPAAKSVDANGGFAWSSLVSPATLEDEIKSIKLQLDQDVTTPGKFAGNGYKACRRHFSSLALMFAIVGEYDGSVRWKKDAPAARDLFARAASNCKVGSQQAFNEARMRKTDLQEMVGGGSLAGKPAPAATAWPEVAERSPLMQRLEAAIQGRLQLWTANKAEFGGNLESVLHQAEIVAAISEVLVREGMDDADDEDYAAYALQMKQAALELVIAAKQNSYQAANTAMGTINKTCNACHEHYR